MSETELRIVVTVAPVHDCRYPVVIDPVRKRIDPSSLRRILNPPDSIALEQALRIREGNRDCRISVVTIGPPASEDAIRMCLAVGADQVVRVWEDGFEDENLDSQGIAFVLAHIIRTWSAQLVLTGWKTADMEHAQTGPILAELLGIPQITSARSVALSKDSKHIQVEKRIPGSLLTLCCPLPALVSMDKGPTLRYPRFPDRRRARRLPIQALNVRALGMTELLEPLVQVERFTLPKPKRRTTLGAATGMSAATRIQRIMSSGAQIKKESNIRLCPNRLSTLKAVEYMLEEKLVVLPEDAPTDSQ